MVKKTQFFNLFIFLAVEKNDSPNLTNSYESELQGDACFWPFGAGAA